MEKIRTQLPKESIKDVQTLLAGIKKLHPRVQSAFAGLIELYEAGLDWYDPGMDFSEFNLRYPSHPRTNWSEMLAMHWLVTRTGNEVEVDCSQDGQSAGIDLIQTTTDGTKKLVNVKIAMMPEIDPSDKNIARSFRLNQAVYDTLVKQFNHCDTLLLVDPELLTFFEIDAPKYERFPVTATDPATSTKRIQYDMFTNVTGFGATKITLD